MKEIQGKTRSDSWLSSVSLVLLCILYVVFSLAYVSASIGGTYTYTELLPPGWSSSGAYAINSSGVVVGAGFDGTKYKGFIYSNGIYTDVLPDGWTEAYAGWINDSGVVVGWGAAADKTRKGFIAYPPTPEGQMAQLMDFFDASVVAGTVTGSSPGNSGQAQVINVEKLLAAAANSIQVGSEAKACQDLQKAYDRTNKLLSSKDAVAGAAAALLGQQIMDLMENVGCQ